MTAVLIAAAMAYIATNIDDLFINMIYFARAENSLRRGRVYCGKYLGTAVLTAISLAGAKGTAMLPAGFVSLLGIIPLLLGVKALWDAFHPGQEENVSAPAVSFLWGTAAMTVASGADNIGVYIPLFASCTTAEKMMTVAVFAFMTGLWCFFSSTVTNSAPVREFIDRHKKYAVPAVYIFLGIYILMK